MIYMSPTLSYLCGGCGGITDQSQRCVCGSAALVLMDKILGAMKSSYCPDAPAHIFQPEMVGQA